jgi:hypothetical protein
MQLTEKFPVWVNNLCLVLLVVIVILLIVIIYQI